MLWRRYLASLALGLLLIVLESCKPSAEVYMPTVTNTHVTETSHELETTATVPTKVLGEVTATNGKVQIAYPIHQNILTTVFWIGEEASVDNDYIANDVSAWDDLWVNHFGGVDSPNSRNGFSPAGFTPKENPFYFALPYGDYTEVGVKTNVNQIYWYQSFSENTSLLKNRWVKIIANGKASYAQWEDVGPFEEDDINYVFGISRPKQTVGLDVSPAVRDYLGLNGRQTVSWQFVEVSQVPAGPWKEIVTKSNPSWK